jgi:hypothetical protein
MKGIPEEYVDTLLSFVENFNFELYKVISIASFNFIVKRNSMSSENILLHEISIWNSVCFSPTKKRKIDEDLEYFQISNHQLKEIKKFNSKINKVDLHDTEKINVLMN